MPVTMRHGIPRRELACRPGSFGMFLVFLSTLLAATLLTAAPAQAAPLQRLTGSGDQSSGRWQVFDLDQHTSAVDVIGRWEGNGDVNIFLKDADNNTIAYAKASSTGPETISYNGSRQAVKLAVLVKSGSAQWTVEVHDYGTLGESDRVDDGTVAAGAYPGQPASGTIYWGASQTGNQDPYTRIEKQSGKRLGVRRTFFQWNHRTGYMVDIARDDVSQGRLPWVSIKPPSWSSMANGSRDAEIDAMLRALNGVAGPVWLTVHHEPEGGGGVNHSDDPGGPSAHLAMNRRIRSRMSKLGVDNVALVPILMAWTWDPRSGRDPNAWWDGDVYDFVGVDVYDRKGAGLPQALDAWPDLRRWAAARRVDIGVGEWGIDGNDSTSAKLTEDWHRYAVTSGNDDGGARVVALSVYDNDYNNWRMSGAKLEKVRELVGHPNSAHP